MRNSVSEPVPKTDLDRPAFSLCVYCGSRTGVTPAYAEIAREVGRWIGEHQGQLVYGGGRSGLMGILADAALQAGARVIGIIPQALVDREHAHRGCTELLIVDTMHERKRLMAEHSNAFLALPGGIGTFEEFFETWTWRQLGYHDKPLGLLNQDGYYDSMLEFLRHSVSQGFMDEAQMRLIEIGDQATPLLKRLIETAGLPTESRLDKI
ncbi:TIGR00730 family Rossman fold protein [Ottowia caeni]|uniref:LOG family protein n=1 Tax=Ottowia caeni TaxID=2870339 RepID=UPI001E2EA51F|nr:TIGR00730 family Rossman fold protein [Ottowia caeni]